MANKSSTDQPDIPFQEIVADLNSYIRAVDKTKRGYNWRSEATQDKIRARFKERLEANEGDVAETVADFKQVHKIKALEWLHTDMAKYYRPETLYRPSHFESYLNQIDCPTILTDDQKRTMEAIRVQQRRQSEPHQIENKL